MDKDTVTSSINAYLSDKISSPFTASFIVSWSAWNYKLLLILFSTKGVEKKFEYIGTKLYPECSSVIDCSAVWGSGFLYPLITAILALLFFPIPNTFIYTYWKLSQALLTIIKNKIDRVTPLSQGQAQALWDRVAAAKAQVEQADLRHAGEVELLEARNKKLENQLQNHESTAIDKLESSIHSGYSGLGGDGSKGPEPAVPVMPSDSPLEDKEIHILEMLSQALTALNTEQLRNRISGSASGFGKSLQRLQEVGLVMIEDDAQFGKLVTLTDKGRNHPVLKKP